MDWRLHTLALLLLALGAALRLPLNDALPSPAGDETNWLTLADAAARGEVPKLSADAAFVPPTFAHLLGLGVRLLGPTFAATRTALALAFLAGVGVVYVLARQAGFRRGAVLLVALLTLHPWPVAWTRVAAVPYALGLVVALAGPLAWLAALQIERPWRRAVALVAAGQLLVLGLHFSPLGSLPLVACALWLLLPEYRRHLASPGPWLALMGVLAHAWPLLVGAVEVAQATTGTAAEAPAQDVASRAAHYLAVAADGLTGLGTLRHFALGPCAWPVDPTWTLRTVWLAALVWAATRGQHRPVPWQFVVGLVVAVIGLPLLLLPTRTWWLPTIDAERYLFVVLAPAWLLVARLAEAPGRQSWTAAALIGVAVLPTAAGARAALSSAGPDCGLQVADAGGGWRGFRSVRGLEGEIQAQSEAVWRAAALVSEGTAYTLVAHDQFGQQTLGWPPARARDDRHRLVWAANGKWPNLPAGRQVIVPLYAPSVFAPSFLPLEIVLAASQLRSSVQERLREPRRALVLTDPGGAPLWEIWTGRVR